MKRACLFLLVCLLVLAGCTNRSVAAAGEVRTLSLTEPRPEVVPSPSTVATREPTQPPATDPPPDPTPTFTPEPTPCPHTVWIDGVCAACGAVCAHPAWNEGICPVCGSHCPHTAHDPNTLICAACGLSVPHNFLGSKCDMCGAVPTFIDGMVPRELFEPIDRRGTVETLGYQTLDYNAQRRGETPATISKSMQVYLPYGYDPAEKYDLLILLHGMGGTETYWLTDQQRYYMYDGEDLVQTTSLLDNLMDSGYCRKMIVATPCFYRDGTRQGDYVRPDDEDQFVRELREDILPLLIERYSTYARSSDPENIAAARKHFAYAGLSMGSIYAYTSIMPFCLDYFSWFGCFSGSDGDMNQTAAAINSGTNASYPIYYFYNSISVYDSMYGLQSGQYATLMQTVDGLTDGVNAAFTSIQQGGHVYQSWCTGLYNFLRVVFAQPQEY